MVLSEMKPGGRTPRAGLSPGGRTPRGPFTQAVGGAACDRCTPSGLCLRTEPQTPKSLLLEGGEDLRHRALPALHGPVEVALEVLGGVLAGEVAAARGLALGPGEARVLPGLP